MLKSTSLLKVKLKYDLVINCFTFVVNHASDSRVKHNKEINVEEEKKENRRKQNPLLKKSWTQLSGLFSHLPCNTEL